MEKEKKITNVYIDGANLKQGILGLGYDISYEKLHTWLVKRYRAEKIIIFLGYIKKNEDFYTSLKLLGYEIIFKETYFEENILKANCDAELILNAVIDYYDKKYNKAIIVSGDGDFTCLIKFLLNQGALERVIAPSIKRCSVFLKRSTTKIVYLESMLDLVTDEANVINKKAPDEDSPVPGSLS